MNTKMNDERFRGKLLTIQNLVPTVEEPSDTPNVAHILRQLKKKARVATRKNVNAPLMQSLRLELGLSPAEFAARLGISVPTVSRWENPEGNPIPRSKIGRIESLLFKRISRQTKPLPLFWVEVDAADRPKLWGIDVLAVQEPDGNHGVEMQTWQLVTFCVCIVQRPWNGDYEPVLRACDVRRNTD